MQWDDECTGQGVVWLTWGDGPGCNSDSLIAITINTTYTPVRPVITGETLPTVGEIESYEVPLLSGYIYYWAVDDSTIGEVISAVDNILIVRWNGVGITEVIVAWTDPSDICTIADTSIDVQVRAASGIGDNQVKNQFVLFPNPAYELLYVDIKQPTEVIISNLLGEIMLQQQVEIGGKLDISALAPGMYLVYDQKRSSVAKFIKEAR